jgi:hypothetical protein
MQRCIECERLWRELSDAAKAYVKIYSDHRRRIELHGASRLISRVRVAAQRRKNARQALRDHEAGLGVVVLPCHRLSENVAFLSFLAKGQQHRRALPAATLR